MSYKSELENLSFWDIVKLELGVAMFRSNTFPNRERHVGERHKNDIVCPEKKKWDIMKSSVTHKIISS